MNSLLVQYAAYNNWANQKLLIVISQLDEERLRQQIISSFPGIFKTLLHLLDAESIWWQRSKMAGQIEVPSQYFSGNFEELKKMLLIQSALWEEWVTTASETQLQQALVYKNRRGEQFEQPMNEVLLHLFNHGSYHRGQLVTMLRQLGIDTIPSTDFIEWSRSKE